ncbi:MAG: WD40/YVTN/BNR-like repeat-containing protein [Gammaproteobacteria bacterium]
MSCKTRISGVCGAALVVLLLVGLNATAADTAPISAELFAGLHWRNIGPFHAGRTVAGAGVAGEPYVFYIGAVDGGVWKTTNAGWTWKPIFDHEPVASIGAIAVAPSDPNIIYVGTGEADPRSEMSYGDGMYKSTDAGKTWTHIGLDKSMEIGTIIVDPHNPERLFAAALGNIYAANPERGIYRSTDGGQTWQKVLYKNANVGGMSLAFDPDNSQIVYASLWATRRPPWSVYPPSIGPGSGIYKSIDGGTTWKQLTDGLPTEGVGKIGIAVAPTDPNRVYAIIGTKTQDGGGGLYRSDNAGATWTLADSDPRIWGRQWYFGRVTVDPKNENTLYVMNVTIYRSTDGGVSFDAWKGNSGGNDFKELWINPTDTNLMLSTSDMLGGVVTLDGGKIWSTWNNQPTGQYYGVYADNQSPFWAGGAMQDSGGHSVASDVSSGRITYSDVAHTCTGGESDQVAADPLSVAELYGSGFGGPTKCDMLTGTSESISPLLAYPDTVFRHDWTIPVAFSMANKHAFYYANQSLFQTTDGGQTWQKISPDLSREHPGIPSNLDPTAAADTTYNQKTFGPRWGVIYTIAPSPLAAGTIWVGTDDGLIWVTHDDGKHWNNVTPKSVTAWSKVIMIGASHFDANTAYAAIDRHRLNDFAPHVSRTTDGGKTWQDVDSGLPSKGFVEAIKQDPERQGMLWAGTQFGVYVSFDQGDHWQSLSLNMPPVEIRDFAFKNNSVAIATFGRGLWVLDDLSPLRQVDAAIADSPAYLFKPEPATLPKGGGGFGGQTNLVAAADMDVLDIWSGEPRMKGAIVDYYLKSDADGPVTLDVLDSSGQVISHYSSATVYPEPDPKSLTVPLVWVTRPAPLLAAAGMHRFAWDLRVVTPRNPAATGVEAFFGGGGHEALPGQYTVRLTVDGQSYSQPLTVEPPAISRAPRIVRYNAENKQAQVQLLGRIQSLQGEVSEAERDAGKLRAQLATLGAHATGPLANSIRSMDEKARRLQGFAAPPAPNTSGEGAATPATDSLMGLGSTLRGLGFALQQGGTSPPKPAIVTGFDKTRATAQRTLTAWRQLKMRNVEQLNVQLRKADLPAIRS